jgi:hypothetical protein
MAGFRTHHAITSTVLASRVVKIGRVAMEAI